MMSRMHRYSYFLQLVGLPLLALLLWLWNPMHLTPGANTAVATGILMIGWWVSETLPMPAVALLPLLLFPLFGISSIETAAKAYSNPVIFLFMGGFLLGLAMEKWNLHKRIALLIVKRTGTSGNRIILGFILASGFLSMWLSNTATTMMMFPIAMSVISVMKEHEQPGTHIRNFSLVLMLVIAYASNIGGMATIIGTPPNVAFVGFIEKKYNYTIQFLDWMLVCTPLSMLLLAAMYFVFTHWLFPNRISDSRDVNLFIEQELRQLGPVSSNEKRVLLIFLSTAALWITKDFINQLNWFRLDDNMIAITGALALFATPASADVSLRSKQLLEWSDTSKMSWGILLLFGGGIALAGALEETGVMQLIGNKLAHTGPTNGIGLVVVVVVVSIFLSEVMSNVAQVIVFAPVLAAMADALQLDPLLLGIPMTLAASAASMLPMGTPPNAIVFGSGHVPLKDMLRAGFVINLLCIVLISLFCWFILPLVMKVI